MVLPDSDSLSRVESYSGYPLGLHSCPLRGFHPLWPVIPDRSGTSSGPTTVLQPQKCKHLWFGLVRFRSPLLTESLLFSSPPGTEMFQFPGFAREPRDQRSVDNSPGTIAAFHALEPPGAQTSPTRPSYRDWETDRKSTRLNSSHSAKSRMPSSA